jgi:hypothetical protein
MGRLLYKVDYTSFSFIIAILFVHKVAEEGKKGINGGWMALIHAAADEMLNL